MWWSRGENLALQVRNRRFDSRLLSSLIVGMGWHGIALDGMVLHWMASDGIGWHGMVLHRGALVAMDGIRWHGIKSDGIGGMGWHGITWDGMVLNRMALDGIGGMVLHRMASDGTVLSYCLIKQ